MTDPLAYAIVGHLVGDYILQNDWQSANKKKSTAVCAWHCYLWTVAVVIAMGVGGLPVFTPHSHILARWGWLTAAVLFVSHFIQDRTQIIRWWMCSVNGQKTFYEKLGPWSFIMVDNVFHLVVIAAVCRYWS